MVDLAPASERTDSPDWSAPTSALAVGLVVLLLLVLLAPQLRLSAHDVNDGFLHLSVIERMVAAVEAGENPIDHWHSAWILGYPVPRTYQPVGHLLVVASYFVLGKSVEPLTIFSCLRLFLLITLPVSFYWMARGLGLSRRIAVMTTFVSPWAVTPNLYGLELGSFVWRGFGLYAQLVATHFILFSLGGGVRALRSGRGLVGAGILVGLTFLSHVVYGYMAALSLVAAAAVHRSPSAQRRFFRLAVIGAVAFLLTLWFVVPLLVDGFWINKSVFEPEWKWNSQGWPTVLIGVVAAYFLDAGRLPVLLLLALLGLYLQVRALRQPETARSRDTSLLLLSGCLLWLAVLLGRSLWGPLLDVIGIVSRFHLHRVLAGLQLFLLVLAGTGLARLSLVAERRLPSLGSLVGVLTGVLVLSPVVSERIGYLDEGQRFGRENEAAFEQEGEQLSSALEAAAAEGGRIYPGLKAGWGGNFKIGHTPVYAVAGVRQIPAVSFMAHTMGRTSDIMALFDESRPDHYRLFGVGGVIADESTPLADFLQPIGQWGRFRALSSGEGGYFDLVDADYSFRVSEENFFDVNRAWLKSAWVEARQHLVLHLSRQSPAGSTPLPSVSPLPPPPASEPAGAIVSETKKGELYRATVALRRPAVLLFKMNFHPNWVATSAGRSLKTTWLSPGFVGVSLENGVHDVLFEYRPDWWRLPLLCVSLLLGVCVRVGATAGRLAAWESGFERRLRDLWPTVERWGPVAGPLMLSLPIVVPLATGLLPGGHDTFDYFPRLVEFWANLTGGQLWPVWAADLSFGYGQPFFLFNPPVIDYLGSIGLAVGLDQVAALNLACVMIVFATAWTSSTAGRYFFGNTGGWLAAAAYLYSPYFIVDLYARHALAEFAAFPFYPLVIYGLVRNGRQRRHRHLVLAAAAYSAVLYCHLPAALLFSPVVLAVAVGVALAHSSWRLLAAQLLGILMALGLSASMWMPILWRLESIAVDRLLEGSLQYANHFVYVHQLIWPGWGYGLSVSGYSGDDMSFSLGLGHLVLIGFVLFLWFRRRELWSQPDRKLVPLLLLPVPPLLFIMLPGSLWFWDHLPLLKYVEFPWRALAPVTALMALATAALGIVLSGRWKWTALCLALLVVPQLHQLAPERYWTVDYSFWTPDQIASRGVAVTTRREYQTRWLIEWPQTLPRQWRTLAGSAEMGPILLTAGGQEAAVSVSEFATVEAGLAYFPGWTVIVNGRVAPAQLSPDSGLVRFDLPAGRHTVLLRWQRAPVQWLALLITLLAATLCAVLLWRDWKERRTAVDSRHQELDSSSKEASIRP